MLESEDKSIQKIAVEIIRESRELPPQPPQMKTLKGIRKLLIPELNWKAKNWT